MTTQYHYKGMEHCSDEPHTFCWQQCTFQEQTIHDDAYLVHPFSLPILHFPPLISDITQNHHSFSSKNGTSGKKSLGLPNDCTQQWIMQDPQRMSWNIQASLGENSFPHSPVQSGDRQMCSAYLQNVATLNDWGGGREKGKSISWSSSFLLIPNIDHFDPHIRNTRLIWLEMPKCSKDFFEDFVYSTTIPYFPSPSLLFFPPIPSNIPYSFQYPLMPQ